MLVILLLSYLLLFVNYSLFLRYLTRYWISVCLKLFVFILNNWTCTEYFVVFSENHIHIQSVVFMFWRYKVADLLLCKCNLMVHSSWVILDLQYIIYITLYTHDILEIQNFPTEMYHQINFAEWQICYFTYIKYVYLLYISLICITWKKLLKGLENR